MGNEFEIDQPAPAGFEIERLVLTLLARDEAAHLRDVLENPRRIALAGAKLRQQARRFFAQCCIPRDRAGAGEGHLLPGLGLVLLIAGEAGDRQGNRTLVARGAQAQIDLVGDAARRGRAQRRNQPLGQARAILAGFQHARSFGLRALRAVIENDEVEIGGRRHFPPAQLPKPSTAIRKAEKGP